jgi:hypothetical protein
MVTPGSSNILMLLYAAIGRNEERIEDDDIRPQFAALGSDLDF